MTDAEIRRYQKLLDTASHDMRDGVIKGLGHCDDILPLTDEEIQAYKQDKANEEQNINNPISDIRE